MCRESVLRDLNEEQRNPKPWKVAHHCNKPSSLRRIFSRPAEAESQSSVEHCFKTPFTFTTGSC